eukprot:6560986-Karenia_brevis.AAC.1
MQYPPPLDCDSYSKFNKIRFAGCVAKARTHKHTCSWTAAWFKGSERKLRLMSLIPDQRAWRNTC